MPDHPDALCIGSQTSLIYMINETSYFGLGQDLFRNNNDNYAVIEFLMTAKPVKI